MGKQVGNCEQKSRHCGLDPQSFANNAFNKVINTLEIIIMLKVFDYIFYRQTKFLNRMQRGLRDYIWTKRHPNIPIQRGGLQWWSDGLDAACGISAIQSFNIMTLWVVLFSSFFSRSVTGVVFVSIFASIFILNPIFFLNAKKLRKCEERWNNETNKTKRLRGVLVVVYFLASFIAFILVFAIKGLYLGN